MKTQITDLIFRWKIVSGIFGDSMLEQLGLDKKGLGDFWVGMIFRYESTIKGGIYIKFQLLGISPYQISE